MLAEWETRRPYLATVCLECQLWKSAPDAAFESPFRCRRPWAGKQGRRGTEEKVRWQVK